MFDCLFANQNTRAANNEIRRERISARGQARRAHAGRAPRRAAPRQGTRHVALPGGAHPSPAPRCFRSLPLSSRASDAGTRAPGSTAVVLRI